jgi:hypothetical protein
MGFFSNIKNRARGMANDLGPSNMPTDRQNAFVNPVRPGMIPQLPGRVGLPDANGYYPGDDRYGGGFTRGPRNDSETSPGTRPSSPPPIRPRTRPSLLPRAPKKLGGLSGLGGLLPQQNLDFLSRLPKNMMPNLDFSNLPQMSGNPNIPAPDGYELREDEKGMNYFLEQLSPEDQAQNMLPRRLDVPFQDFNLQNMRPGYFDGRDVNIDDGGMVDFLNSNPEQVLFGIENRIGILQNQLQEAESNRDRESYDMIVQEINNADAQRIEIMNSMKPNPNTQDFQQRGFDQVSRALLRGGVKRRDNPRMDIRESLNESGRTISNMDRSYIDDILSSLEKKN